MDERPIKVSVQMLAYNHEKYIRQALESVVMQKTNFRFEAVVAEDCSTDGTRAIVQEYAEKYPDIIRPLYREKNLGGGKNALTSSMECIGEYVAFLECDDYWLDPLKLQKQADYLDAHPECSAVMGGVLIVDRYGQVMATVGQKCLDHALETPMDYVKNLYPHYQFHYAGARMTRNFFRDESIVRIRERLTAAGDFVMFALVVSKGQIGFLEDKLVAYRWVTAHGVNFNAQKSDYVRKEIINTLRMAMEILPPITHRWIYLKICSYYYWQAYDYLLDGACRKALRLFLKEMTLREKWYYLKYLHNKKTKGWA